MTQVISSVVNHIIILLFIIIIVLAGQFSSIMGDYIELNYTQKIDHFGYYEDKYEQTFVQKVLLDDRYWAGAKVGAPIFVYFGGEAGEKYGPDENGIMSESGVEFKALLVHIQHRFYGESVPFGSIELAMADERIRRSLTTKQALQDFAEIIMSLKSNYSAFASPVIVIGCGYAGALAAWFRLTYPELVVGALASSAPLLYYGNYTSTHGFCEIVSKDFEDVNPKCYEWIRQTWRTFDKVAAQPDGLKHLSHAFNTCSPIESSETVKQWLGQMYSSAAMYIDSANMDIDRICGKMTNEDNDLAGIATAYQQQTFKSPECFDNVDIWGVESPFEPPSNGTIAWAWQRCTELIFPVGCEKTTMLPSRPFVRSHFEDSCRRRFGVSPRPNTPITFFHGRNVAESLKGFGGNIIFSNGLRDPFSSGGILEDVSKTIVAIKSTQGSHCSEVQMKNDFDPKWLKNYRKEELKIFRRWINIFHHTNKGSKSTPNALLIYSLEILFFLYIYA